MEKVPVIKDKNGKIYFGVDLDAEGVSELFSDSAIETARLSQKRAAVKSKMVEGFRAAIARGADVKIGDAVFKCQCCEEDINSLTATMENYRLGGITTTNFRGRDNAWIKAVPRATYEEILKKLLHYTSALRVKKGEYVDAIEACSTMAQVAAIKFDWSLTLTGVTPGDD